MPARFKRPIKQACLLSLVSITIILLVTAPRARFVRLALASSTRYSISGGPVPNLSADQGPADLALTAARVQARTLRARRGRLAALRPAAIRRAARTPPSAPPGARRPSPPTAPRTSPVDRDPV